MLRTARDALDPRVPSEVIDFFGWEARIVPIITVSGPFISLEQKREMARGLTEAACQAYQRPAEQIIVVIRENAPENVAIGGELIADLHAK